LFDLYTLYHLILIVKVNSHIACRAHAVPLTCRATKGLDCVFLIWFTQCGRVWFTLAMLCSCHAHSVLRPCSSERDFSRPLHSTAWARHAMCELALMNLRVSRSVGHFLTT